MQLSPICRHIMPSGKRCGSPALRGGPFCYYHSNVNRVERARQKSLSMPLASIEDLHGIQLALTQLFNLIDNPYADTSRIKQMLSLLRLATHVVIHAPSLPQQPSPCPNCGHLTAPSCEPLEVETSGRNGFLPTAIGSPEELSEAESSTPRATADELIEKYKAWDRPLGCGPAASTRKTPAQPGLAAGGKDHALNWLRQHCANNLPAVEIKTLPSSVP